MYFRPGGRDDRERYMYSFLTVEQYLKKKCNGEDIAQVFYDNGYKSVAIYGAGELGECLYKDLIHSNIVIDCFVETNSESFYNGKCGLPVISVKEVEKKCKADVIVISAIYYTNEIIDALLQYGWPLEKIMNLSDVVY